MRFAFVRTATELEGVVVGRRPTVASELVASSPAIDKDLNQVAGHNVLLRSAARPGFGLKA